MKRGLVIAGLLALVVGIGGEAAAGEDPLDLDFARALFGTVYRYDPAADFLLDTWIWLSVISGDSDVHIQFYDPACNRTNDQTIPMTENETVLLFASEVVPDSRAGAFLVEALNDKEVRVLGELWYLDFDQLSVFFSRPLYAPAVRSWDIFQHEHWDWVVNGFTLFNVRLWLNCPAKNLDADLRHGRAVPFERTYPGDCPPAELVDFVLINFDESPRGSRDDFPCACLTDGPVGNFSGLFTDFWGLVRLRFKTKVGGWACGLPHKTDSDHVIIFDKRFHRFQVERGPQ